MKKKTKSIKLIITISFLIGLIIPVTCAGLLFVKISADLLREEIVLRNRQLSIKLTEQIDEHLTHPIHSLNISRELINNGSISENQINILFDTLLSSHGDFLKIQMVDNNGIVSHISPFDENFIGIDVSNLDLFKQPYLTKKLYWSPSFMSLQLDRPVVSVSIPLDNGIITGFISLVGLNDMVKSSLVGKNNYITITDQTGIFIEHPDPNKVTQREFDPNFGLFSKGQPGGEIIVESIQIDGKKMLGFAGTSKRTKWAIVVYQSVEDLFLPVRKLYAVSIGCILFIFAIVIYLSLKHVRKIMKEISRFSGSAKIISDGHYNERISNIQYAEFENLAEQFNKMAESVEEREVTILENEKKLRQILDSVGVGIFMINPENFSITYVNPEAAKILKRPINEIIGIKCTDIVRNINKENCPAISSIDKVNVSERELINGEGEVTPVLKTAIMTNFEGRESIIESFIDLSHLKKIEDAKIKLEQQLRQVQKMEAIGTLAGGIAHDFNNILFPIIGYAEMSLEDLPKESLAHSNIQEVLTAANRAKEMVKQILAFSRQSQKELKLSSIQSILAEVLNLIRTALPSNIEIKQKLQNTGQILVDPTQIHQVIMNLMTNAFHAMEETGGSITIILKEIMIDEYDKVDTDIDEGKYISLTISDTGAGMDKHTLERVFDPYFTTRETGKGTGLGLSVVHGIIKGYKGVIKAYSEKGIGSSFTIHLPVSEPEKQNNNVNGNITVKGGNEKILVVDDEPQVLNLLRLTLESLGYTVTSTLNSIDALNEFSQSPDNFDLVITDMTMPKMTGLQLSHEIRILRPDMPIIICSGFSEQLTKEKIEILGIKGVVMKPVIKAEIAETIRVALAT
jgi:signal transduction histidine kinase/ActR/RegA family two-component response regulator